MINSLTYLTRRCPNKCSYCKISREKITEMAPQLWTRAWDILKELGVTFNLILGNEPWILGYNLPIIMQHNQTPFAMYTSCNTLLYTSYSRTFFNSFLDNFSCAVDYSKDYLHGKAFHIDDMERKSENSWFLLRCVKEDYPKVDCQGLITIHAKNLDQVPSIVKDLSEMGVFVGVNLIHHARDDQIDFAPTREEMEGFLLDKPGDVAHLAEVFQQVKDIPNNLVMNPDYLDYQVEKLVAKAFHCAGNPYGGPTIDADGSLRCCGYRRGKHTSKLHIFDLPKKLDAWKEAVHQDASECAGCSWGYMLMYHKLLAEPEFGKKVFTKHAIKGLEESKWSNRKIEE